MQEGFTSAGVKSEIKSVAKEYSSDIIQTISLVLDLLISAIHITLSLGNVRAGLGGIITLVVFTVIGIVFMALAVMSNACTERKVRNCCVVFFMDVLVSIGALLYLTGDNLAAILKIGIDLNCTTQPCLRQVEIASRCLLFAALLIWRVTPLLFNQCKAKENKKNTEKGDTNDGNKLWWYPFHMLALLVEYNAIYSLAWRDPFLSGQGCQIVGNSTGNPVNLGSLVSWAVAGGIWLVFVIVYFCLIAKAWKHCCSCDSKCTYKHVLAIFQLLCVCFIAFPYILSDNAEPIICICNQVSTFCNMTLGTMVRAVFIWLAVAIIFLEFIFTVWLLCRY